MNIQILQKSCEPAREKLLNHPVYDNLVSTQALHQFMSLHVYAVWDFMSLLKSLQQGLTCVGSPWLPPTDRIAARMINEIVLGEESDLDPEGNPASHFELYIQSMQELGSDPSPVLNMIDALHAGHDRERACSLCDVPQAAQEFMNLTFQIVDQGDLPAIASAFTLGRENLIPGIFRGIVEALQERGEIAGGRFLYYLDRHISLDEDEHGPLAFGILKRLCGDDPQKWESAKRAALESLEARLRLWNAINNAIVTDPNKASLEMN
jgi:hypothetical protein